MGLPRLELVPRADNPNSGENAFSFGLRADFRLQRPFHEECSVCCDSFMLGNCRH